GKSDDLNDTPSYTLLDSKADVQNEEAYWARYASVHGTAFLLFMPNDVVLSYTQAQQIRLFPLLSLALGAKSRGFNCFLSLQSTHPHAHGLTRPLHTLSQISLAPSFPIVLVTPGKLSLRRLSQLRPTTVEAVCRQSRRN